MNEKMSKDLENCSFKKNKLSPKLLQVVWQGFFRRNGCFFLTCFAERLDFVSLKDFPDKTGYECFINSIHIDDYYAGKAQLVQGLVLINEVLSVWDKKYSSQLLVCILSKSNDNGVTIKMHLHREGEHWLDGDLEVYKDEGVLVVDSNETTFLAGLEVKSDGIRC